MVIVQENEIHELFKELKYGDHTRLSCINKDHNGKSLNLYLLLTQSLFLGLFHGLEYSIILAQYY